VTAEYTLKARLAPTALATPPLLLLGDALFHIQASQWLDSSTMTWLFGEGVASAALVYFMMQVNRLIGLDIFQRWVSYDELNFPTTRWLMHDSAEMSAAQRESINQKIHRDFQVALLPESMGDNVQVRRHNADIVGRIRVYVGGPPKLLQFNIEYGFFRNLIGASVLVLAAGLANAYLYSEQLLPEWAYRLSFAYSFFAGFLVCLARPITERLGTQYARVLFQTYLETKKPAPRPK
jgi:hypothetical protein